MDSRFSLAILAAATFCLTSCERRPESYREAHGAGACETPACAGHEAGWRWARAHGIDDPDRCGGRNRSFIEGCRAFAGGGVE